MNFNEYFKLALISILSHKMRAFLTMLGIIIGIASLFIIITIGKGGEHVLKSQIAGTSNSIDVYYQPSEEELSENPSSILKDAFSEEDIDNLNRVTGVKDVVANNSISTNIRYKDNEITASTLGATDEYFKVNEVKVIEGRGFSITDFLGGQPVAIINQELLEEVFKYDNVLEEVIWVGDYPIKVIGVTESEDGVINSNPTLYLPWNSFKNTFSIKNFNQLTVTVQDAEYITMIGKEILEILNNSNNTENSYQVVNFEEVTTLIEQITTT
ncbi:MAG: ABC transporter permease, partial [Carnobacterium alterfunditum]